MGIWLWKEWYSHLKKPFLYLLRTWFGHPLNISQIEWTCLFVLGNNLRIGRGQQSLTIYCPCWQIRNYTAQNIKLQGQQGSLKDQWCSWAYQPILSPPSTSAERGVSFHSLDAAEVNRHMLFPRDLPSLSLASPQRRKEGKHKSKEERGETRSHTHRQCISVQHLTRIGCWTNTTPRRLERGTLHARALKTYSVIIFL